MRRGAGECGESSPDRRDTYLSANHRLRPRVSIESLLLELRSALTNLCEKEAKDFARFHVHAATDRLAFREQVKRVKERHGVLHRAGGLKRGDHGVCHGTFEVFHIVLELAKVVVPLRRLDVQNVVLHFPKCGNLFDKLFLDGEQGLPDFRPANAAKLRQSFVAVVARGEGELRGREAAIRTPHQ